MDRKSKLRCSWCGEDPLYIAYHDKEWGTPLHDDGKLFEMLILEGFQAGLSWITILRKRENFRKAFACFDAQKLARFTKRDITRLLKDEGIVRNHLKIQGAIINARCFLEVQEEFRSFDNYLWQFTNHKTMRFRSGHKKETLRTTSAESDAMSKDLRARGFKFVGSTICYAHMQATGMIDDHMEGCFKYRR